MLLISDAESPDPREATGFGAIPCVVAQSVQDRHNRLRRRRRPWEERWNHAVFKSAPAVVDGLCAGFGHSVPRRGARARATHSHKPEYPVYHWMLTDYVRWRDHGCIHAGGARLVSRLGDNPRQAYELGKSI
ncbi:hypothetical protein [Actinomyces glycerinitolerans]|uniref:hypothetical protein n=1 Tax=Actinomyces glycerinitolerans TaxID=1892869 RepID=UPI001114F7E7|nr:hypothetical protein [Actinomyces glycerinitolerans]